MAFMIEDFKAAISDRGGVMRANKFHLRFNLPQVLLEDSEARPWNTKLARDMSVWCTSINVPGVDLLTAPVRRWTFGPEEKRPIDIVYKPIQATFLSDGDGDLLYFFNCWTQFIIPHDWFNGGINQLSNFNGRQYEVEYKSRYATDLAIEIFNVDGSLTERYYIKEAFPSAIAEIPLSWEDNNSHVKFVVQFDYLDWTTTTYDWATPDSDGDLKDPARGVGRQKSPITVEFPNVDPGVEY